MLDFISQKNTMVSKRGFGNSNPQQRFALFPIFILLPQIFDFIFMGQVHQKFTKLNFRLKKCRSYLLFTFKNIRTIIHQTLDKQPDLSNFYLFYPKLTITRWRFLNFLLFPSSTDCIQNLNDHYHKNGLINQDHFFGLLVLSK